VNNLISPPGDVAGAILVGGRSQRFGKDKVLLPFQGKPLIAHLCGILEPLVREILIVGHPRPEFEALNLRVVEDLLPDAGPLGGIYTALKSTRASFVLVLAADMPFLSPSLLEELLKSRQGRDAVIPRGPRDLEPLCAIYSRTCLDPVRRSLEKGANKIVRAIKGMNVLTPEIAVNGKEKNPFFNINFPEDYEGLKAWDRRTGL